jgi:glycerophosphoryl diester phosphodiesterase
VAERSFSQGTGHGPGRRLVVAHRGASAVEAENTIAAFEAAVEAGADVVEFDVRMTADDRAVVVHDADVARTTDGAGLVASQTLAEVKRSRVRTAVGATAEIPTLEEALACLSGRAAVDVELKNVPGEPDFEPDRERAADAVLAALHAGAFLGEVLISSFNPLSIAHVRARDPDVATGLLTSAGVDARAALSFAADAGHPWILPWVGQVAAAGEDFPAEVHERGLLLGAWITDEPSIAVSLWRSGVDAVATNDPAVVVAARREAFGA